MEIKGKIIAVFRRGQDQAVLHSAERKREGQL